MSGRFQALACSLTLNNGILYIDTRLCDIVERWTYTITAHYTLGPIDENTWHYLRHVRFLISKYTVDEHEDDDQRRKSMRSGKTFFDRNTIMSHNRRSSWHHEKSYFPIHISLSKYKKKHQFQLKYHKKHGSDSEFKKNLKKNLGNIGITNNVVILFFFFYKGQIVTCCRNTVPAPAISIRS